MTNKIQQLQQQQQKQQQKPPQKTKSSQKLQQNHRVLPSKSNSTQSSSNLVDIISELPEPLLPSKTTTQQSSKPMPVPSTGSDRAQKRIKHKTSFSLPGVSASDSFKNLLSFTSTDSEEKPPLFPEEVVSDNAAQKNNSNGTNVPLSLQLQQSQQDQSTSQDQVEQQQQQQTPSPQQQDGKLPKKQKSFFIQTMNNPNISEISRSIQRLNLLENASFLISFFFKICKNLCSQDSIIIEHE